MFTHRLVNRLTLPTKHVLICEDDLHQAAALLMHLAKLFGHQGHVEVAVFPHARACYSYIVGTNHSFPDLLFLDHDMPEGNGPELLTALPGFKTLGVPVITFSGISYNNDALMAAGATHKFTKAEVLEGKADDLLKEILKP